MPPVSGSPVPPSGDDAPDSRATPADPADASREPDVAQPDPESGSVAPEVPGAEPVVEPSASAGRGRRYAAGFLSAVVPGLGQFLLGRDRLGLVFILPVAAAVGILAGLIAVVALAPPSDRASLASHLVDPAILGSLLVIQLAILAWRLAAVGSSLLIARPPRYAAVDVLPVVLLVAFVVLPQAYLGAVTAVARDTATSVFESADAGPVWRPSTPPIPTPSPPPTSPGATPGPATPTPGPSPTPAEPRLTILLIGEDSGVGRRTSLTDSMIVASLDPIGKTVSMLSIPRDLVDAPLPGGGVWHPKINELAAYARRNPDAFPGSNGVGQAVLAGTIGELIGVPIDYWAQVNLGGLIRVVDTVGGVDVTAPHGFCDPGYDEYGQQGFGIPAGRWHLNGSQALAYARVRKAAGESDFTRAARQQEVLVGLRDALIRGGFLGDPIGFLEAIGRTVRTNVPPSLLPEVAGYAGEIGRDRVYQAVVRYPLVRPTSRPDPRGSIQIPDVEGIRALAAKLFPTPGVEPAVDREVASPGSAGVDAQASGSSSPGASAQVESTPSTARPSGPAPRPPRVVCRAPVSKPTPAPSPSPATTPAPSGSSEPSPSGEPSPSPPVEPGASPTPEPSVPAATESAPVPTPSPAP